MNLPAVRPDREPLTVAEALSVGYHARRLTDLIELRDKTEGCARLMFGNPMAPGPTLVLNADETLALLALLIERETAFLASFNVDVSEYAK